MRYIEVLEENLDRKAEKNLLPLQPRDVPDTYADVADLKVDVGYEPTTPVETMANFVAWHRDYYGVWGLLRSLSLFSTCQWLARPSEPGMHSSLAYIGTEFV